MVTTGEEVYLYNAPNSLYEVVETDVDRDVEVEGSVWRMPSGNTLLESVDDDTQFLVANEKLLHSVV